MEGAALFTPRDGRSCGLGATPTRPRPAKAVRVGDVGGECRCSTPSFGVPRHLRGSSLLFRRLRLTPLRRARRERLAAVEGGGFGLGPVRLLAAAGHEEEGRPARLSPVE